MKYVLEVCLIALSIGTFAPLAAAQSPAMQKGITVELAPTRNASPMPDADSEDAFVVAVTAKGFIYLGVNPITLPELTEKTRSTPFRRGQAIYIKADARTLYATVLPVLVATSGLLPQVLLTGQSQTTESGSIAPPEGLDVSVGSTFPPGSVATVVQLLHAAQERPLVKINNDEVSWPSLESTLQRHFRKGDPKVVLLRAEASFPFADVVRVIDSCRAAGAKIYLAESGPVN